MMGSSTSSCTGGHRQTRRIAEHVADAFFGAAIAARARGVDVKPAGAATVLDWHHFLCAYDVATLPNEARAYVAFAD